jgi:hypothetical protein
MNVNPQSVVDPPWLLWGDRGVLGERPSTTEPSTGQQRTHPVLHPINPPPNQRPWKHFESGGALYMTKIQTILRRSQAERNFLKIWSLYNVGNNLYRVFATAKRALSFQQKRAFIQEILFSFF